MIVLWLTLVVTGVLAGYAGRIFAQRTGRDPVRWTVAGVLLNVFVLMVMLATGRHSQKTRDYIR
jgi:uncharacterized membrane protein YfcA